MNRAARFIGALCGDPIGMGLASLYAR